MFDHNYIAYLTKESLYLDHLDNSLYGSLAERTCWVHWQLLVTVFADCVVPTGLEDHCSYVYITECTVAVVTLVLTSLLLSIIVIRLLFNPPLPNPCYNFPCYSDASDPKEKNQEKSDEAESVVLLSQF